ncbi:MAG: hypothetical protein ACI9WU_003555 [Myxococcota bacterium]|jgi:hypothetical protein
MLHNVVLARFVHIILVVGIAVAGCKKADSGAPAPGRAPPGAPAVPKAESPGDVTPEPEEALPAPTHIKLLVLDRTTEVERPADLSAGLQALAEKSAEAAGFTIAEKGSDKGNEAGIEVFYALVKDGKPDPKTEKGSIAWAVAVGLRVVDEDGLGEGFEGRRGDERPFVRGAIPDLKAAFESVLGDSMEGAFRDVAMQVRYAEAPIEGCLKALTARHPEERWAAMRRIGELRHKESAQAILDTIDGADELTEAVGVGVLGRLGNPIAVKPLARLAEGPNPERAMLVVTAIAGIGGKDARKYLRLLGASHPSPVVQKMIADLLADSDEAR